MAVITVVIAAFPLIAPTATATSNASSSDGYLPASGALLNQTAATSALDDSTGVEMALAADTWTMQPSGSNWDYTVRVGGIASSRKGITYSFTYGSYTPSPPGNTCNPSDWYGGSLPNYRNLGDNEGVVLGIPYTWYYGAWYTGLWVTENGWVTFDPRATNADPKWVTPTHPASLPSNDPSMPDIVVAPYWTDLHGGQIRWGLTGGGIDHFDVAWVGVLDSSNRAQYFSASFHVTYGFNDRVYTAIRFFYCQVDYSSAVISGIENQLGTQGVNTGHPNTQEAYYFDAGTSHDPSPSVWTAIKSIKINAHKYYSDSSGTATDDPSATVLLRPPGNTDPPQVGEVNVQPLDGAPHGGFLSGSGSGSAFLVSEGLFEVADGYAAISGITLASGDFGGVGFLLIGKDLWDQWTMVWPQSSYQEATSGNGLSTAYFKGDANNEPIPDDTTWNWINWADWDIGLLPTFHWILNDPTSAANVNKVHYLSITMELEIVQLGCTSNCKTSEVSRSITLTWRPYVTGSNTVHYLDWFARTSPDRHTYTFRPLYPSELPQGANFGYHLQSEANGESGYTMRGWSQLTADPSGDYPLDGSHKLAVHGFFRKSEAAGSVSLYVIGHYNNAGSEANDNFENIIQTVPVLTSANDNTWIEKTFVVDVGANYPYSRVKLAIGRFVDQGNSVEAVDWADVSVTTPYYLTITSSLGGTTDPAPGVLAYYPGASVTVTAIPDPGVPFQGWTLDGGSQSGNPITLTMSSSHILGAIFGEKLVINSGIGGYTDPAAGTYYYLPGTQVDLTAYDGGDPCYYFFRWTVDATSMPIGQYSVTVTMDQSHTATAVFKHIRYC